MKQEEVLNKQKSAEIFPGEAEEIKKKASEYDALWNKHLRLCADFDNVRKRWEREKLELIKFGNFRLIKELIVILDELQHALRIAKEHNSDDEIIKGVGITSDNLFGILKSYGLKIIDAVGKSFDPHCHEIVGQRETEDENEHFVLEEVQRGYFLEEKVLRTSKVIVGIKKKDVPREEVPEEPDIEDKAQATEEEDSDIPGEERE